MFLLSKSISLFIAVILCAALDSCSKATPGASDSLSVQAALDITNIALTHGDCATALTTLLPVYNSSSTSNTVRQAMASVYGCSAGVNFFGLVDKITNGASKLGNSNFWTLPPSFFPSTSADRVVESAEYATDAIQATITPGRVLSTPNQHNTTTSNPASDDYTDRVADANTYLFFVSLASVGGLQSRYGKPDSNFLPTQALTWTTASLTVGDGCAFAASVLNFFDSMHETKTQVNASLATEFATIYSAFSPALAQACDYGCKGTLSGTMDWGGTASGCAIAAGCSSCPTTLRDRGSCTGAVTDANSCAAAGIVNWFISDVTPHTVSAPYAAAYTSTNGADPGLGWH